MKKRATLFVLVIGFLFLMTFKSRSVNVLTIQDPDRYGSRDGFIEEATLVVEPHGGYVEESLYLKYSDRGAYAGKSNLEIVHRFELPEGSVVNDMWLWIGDSVMQAIILDTWTARAIYDSIVANKRDPAFLAKNGDQYELHVYPLESNSFRKVKINFITPTKWQGEQAIAPLPYRLLLANNATPKPLTVLIRTQQPVWGDFSFLEDSHFIFKEYTEERDYHYQRCDLEDIGQFNSLNLKFRTNFDDGYFFSNFFDKNNLGYFQLGLLPRQFFNLQVDSMQQKVLFGLDLSGSHNRKIDEFLPHLQTVIESSLKPNDEFKLVAVGEGETFEFNQTWLPKTDGIAQAVVDELAQSDFAQRLTESRKKHILYCDGHASTCWNFPGLENMATYERFGRIEDAVDTFQSADIIAAYDHGYHTPLGDESLATIRSALVPFFNHGGRLLSYIDYNRVGVEKLASSYIDGLTYSVRTDRDLYRNENGNIGRLFPDHIIVNVSHGLTYTDPDVVVELADKQGRPAVISKKIGNGLLVVSGIWSFEDDGALRALLGVPLLGLNSVSPHKQLQPLLNFAASTYQTDAFDKMILFSNSDSLIERQDAAEWIDAYLKNYTKIPDISTINLLDGTTFTPPYLRYDGKNYYGSGTFLNELASRTGGRHFEMFRDDWIFVANTLSPYSLPAREAFEFGINVDNGSGSLVELREVNPVQNDSNKPMFFLGAFEGNSSLDFNISAQFKNIDETRNNTFSVALAETDSATQIIPTMLAFEHLKDLFSQTPLDTAAIVALALHYNLLCDFTALIALEPNEKHHFMKNPLDESDLTLVFKETEAEDDSFAVELYPNPFNERVTFKMNIRTPSFVKVEIYNIRGQLVREILNEHLPVSTRVLSWDATNTSGERVSTGLYFVRFKVERMDNAAVQEKVERVLLIR